MGYVAILVQIHLTRHQAWLNLVMNSKPKMSCTDNFSVWHFSDQLTKLIIFCLMHLQSLEWSSKLRSCSRV